MNTYGACSALQLFYTKTLSLLKPVLGTISDNYVFFVDAHCALAYRSRIERR